MKHDIERHVPLGALDPGERDPRYWERFHDAVLRAAAPELARRRAMPLTVGGVLLSWGRMIVPGAVAAAAVAALLLVPAGEIEEPDALYAVEDILREEADRAALAPVFLSSEAFPEDAFVFAVERAPGGGPR
jgi:hypothetical protein